MSETQEKVSVEVEELELEEHSLIIYNDDVNTFEWIIASLVMICGLSEEQAKKCAMTAHTDGKSEVMSGSFDDLQPLQLRLLIRNVETTIK